MSLRLQNVSEEQQSYIAAAASILVMSASAMTKSNPVFEIEWNATAVAASRRFVGKISVLAFALAII
eukprot:CAMPEP_0119304602 /NCGR_PEP_ID=MMETSP1333-20130426/5784_1 /TAXON_ID=418940 /ORGANISM="Scyphosphaera apsteinii, Strain RCC1455" /LENGTH=66 /DNA_ID=CAMNT_0007307513 /DNA_START=729 /DNA_END=930 /DNA_ORIENTATION=+